LDFTLRELAKSNTEIPEKPSEDLADARHRSMMEAIAPYAKPTVQKNLTPVYINYKTRKTKLVLVLCPEWSPYMPPFSLARLSGVAKSSGYETDIMDLNVLAYRQHQEDWIPNKKLPFRLWDPSASWHWLGDTYLRDIHPVLEPLLTKAVDDIIKKNPDVVGFSMYYISEEPTKWMCQEIKRRAPHIKIAVGGPNVHKSWFQIHPYYDYVVVGEGEVNLLVMLDEIEEGKQVEYPRVLSQPEDERVNINGLPMPDYESIDFSLYDLPNGVNSEISRGCTAKCTFCEETHFWKYRQRQAVDLITEIEWLYYNKGTDVIWFIDSLVNGNLKELRAFCKAVAAKGLKINWTGYSRCDGRMDLEYYKDLKAGGCIMLNYGIESGSQHVLDDMAKGVTIAEMEQNFRDGKEVGIFAATNWIVGFPTETLQDFADSMTFLWRMRNMNINNVGAGVGYGLGPETIVGQNPHKFNISWQKYQGHWITRDFTKGGTHVMHRVKTFHMFLDFMTGCTETPFGYPVRINLAKEHYKIKLNNPKMIREIEYEKFDYDIIKPNINPFADALVNEMWPFFRMLWKTRGGFEAEVQYNPTIDLKEFGTQYGPGMFNAVYKFKISDDGEWEADFDFKFEQIDNPFDDRDPPPAGRKGPFYAQDYSRMMSNTAKRARKLAKPEWDLEVGRDDNDFWKLLEEERLLNEAIDFTFNYRYTGTGNWGNYKQYEVEVSNTSAMNAIPEKETMHTPLKNILIPITSIKKNVSEKV
jgi:anaerobic magnesium-protoporphyrin IX monomethyl ester cyclase